MARRVVVIEKDKKPPSWRLVDRPHLKIQFQWEPRDLWLGLFWRKTKIALHIYICILPMVPLHITKERIQPYSDDEIWDDGHGDSWPPTY